MLAKRSGNNHPTAAPALVETTMTEFSKKFKLGECIGKGAFASVFKCKERSTKQEYAVKRIIKADEDATLELTEWKLGRDLTHDNLVKTLSCFRTPQELLIQLEFVNGGDLFTKLDPSGNGLNIKTGRWYMCQLSSGMAYMHANGIVHCDVKPENVLIHNDILKICDFGLAGVDETQRQGPSQGTGAYMAPELINRRSSIPYVLDSKQDVWSFGVILYAVLFADLPWEKAKPRDPDFHLFCRKGGVSSKLYPFHYLSSDLRRFFGKILHIIPKYRPTMDEITDFFAEPANSPNWYIAERGTLNIEFGLKVVEKEMRNASADKAKKHMQPERVIAATSIKNTDSASVS